MNALTLSFLLNVLPLFALGTPAAVLPVENYSIGDEGYLVHVHGQFSDVCQSVADLVVRKINHSKQTPVEFAVIPAKSSQDTRFCAQAIVGSYDLVVDLRTFDLPVNQPVAIVFAGSKNTNAQIAVIPENILKSTVRPIEHTGRVIRLSSFSREVSEYRFALQVQDSETGMMSNIPLQTQINLERYLGHDVIIGGFTIKKSNECSEEHLENCNVSVRPIRNLGHRVQFMNMFHAGARVQTPDPLDVVFIRTATLD